MFIEYPKALYRDGEFITVTDAAAQEAAEADGFTDWHADQERMQKPADAVQEAAEHPADEEPTRDELKAEAAALGITYARTITTPKLAELVAAAKA